MRNLKALLAVPVLTVGWWVVMPLAPVSADIGSCSATESGTTITLDGNCTTTAPLVVPDGMTLDGNGFTITATDPSPAPFNGAVIANGGPVMNVRNLTVQGGSFIESCPTVLVGIRYNNANGSVSNVQVKDITQNGGCSGALLGRSLVVNASPGTSHIVTVDSFLTTGFQKSGLRADGPATVNVTNSTFGPPDTILDASGASAIAQNAVQYTLGGPHGTFSNNTVVARGFGDPTSESTGILLIDASNMVIDSNTITGTGTDGGVVTDGSTNVTISNNHIERTAPGTPADPIGAGVSVEGAPPPTLVCNTFAGWKTNLLGATQPPCITTNTSLPTARIGSPYSASLEATSPTPPVTWTATGGTLPPGLSLAADGTITGTPTTAGTFTFTVTATDALGGTSTHSFTIIVTAALSPPAVAAGSRLTSLTPARIVDTRSGLGGVTGLTQAGSTNTFTAAGVGGVPATGVTAVVLNVTSDGGSAPGFIQVFPADRGKPGDTSSLNVDHTGQTIANMVIVGVDAGGRFSVFTQSPTHVVVDVFGYFTAVPASSSGRLVTIDPVRVLDTRTGEGTGGSQGPIPAQGTVAVKMTSVIPADAAAVVMTLTADQALAPGYIQAIPTGGGTPLRASSNLNLDRAGEMMANTVISPLGSNGSVTLFTESGADLIVDVVGYFTGQSDASSTTGLFIPIAPNRVRDTRVSGGVVPTGATFQVPFSSTPPLAPLPPSAVAGNLTATDSTGSGYVQLIPTGATTPIGSTSTLNINGANRTVAASNILSGVTGSITVHNETATQLIYDVTGFFL